MSIALESCRSASRYCTRQVMSLVSTPMKPTVYALMDPSSPHALVLAGEGGSPFWALSSEPPRSTLLWAMNLARETNFDPDQVPSFMAHFGGEVTGMPFAALDDCGPRLLAAPPPEAYGWLGFVLDAPPVELVTLADVARRTGISYSRLHAWSMTAGWPERAQNGKHSWPEVEAWLRVSHYPLAKAWAANS